MTTNDKNIFSTNSPANNRFLLTLLIASIILALGVIFLWQLPQKIVAGEQGHKTIKMLDEIRRPLLAIKAAETQVEEGDTESGSQELSIAIETADALVEEYFILSQYNQELVQSVTDFKKEYIEWAHALGHYHIKKDIDHDHPDTPDNTIDHYLATSKSFLNVMSLLGEGEVPIHQDIDEGRLATKFITLMLSIIILTQFIAFTIQVIIKNSKLKSTKAKLENEVAARAEAQEQIDFLVENTPGVIYSCKYDNQKNFIPTFCTPNIKKMMGYSSEDFLNEGNLWAANIHPEDAPTVFNNYQRLFQDNQLLHRYRWRHKNGEYIWVRDEITLIKNKAGEPEQIVGVWVNIDEQKAVEIELEEHKSNLEVSVENLTRKNLEISRILNEKDILFKELHHRVKNNMQVVSALLSLQAMKCDNDEVLIELAKGKDRIDSMALVHELLYQTDDMSRVDVIKYIENLGQMLLESHQEETEDITISVEGERCLLLAESIVPLGLIINELLTNSFRHGLSGAKDGKVEIACHANDGDHLVVHYSDNGIGVPESVLSGTHKSLGLNLIENLSKQLDATVKFYNDDGMHFEITAVI